MIKKTYKVKLVTQDGKEYVMSKDLFIAINSYQANVEKIDQVEISRDGRKHAFTSDQWECALQIAELVSMAKPPFNRPNPRVLAIKALRRAFNLSLGESKDLVEEAYEQRFEVMN